MGSAVHVLSPDTRASNNFKILSFFVEPICLCITLYSKIKVYYKIFEPQKSEDTASKVLRNRTTSGF